MPTENVSFPNNKNIKIFSKVPCNTQITNFGTIKCLPVQPSSNPSINNPTKPTIMPM